MSELLKKQKFGVEVEFTGITRTMAAEAVAEILGSHATGPDRTCYRTYTIRDSKRRIWKVMRDSSICPVRKAGRELMDEYRVEFVTPPLNYEDIETLQSIIRKFKELGGVPHSSCGIHIHVDGANHTATSLRRLVNFFFSRQEIIYDALAVGSRKDRWCKPVCKDLLDTMKKEKDLDARKVEEIWYSSANDQYHGGIDHSHYNSTRYHALNLHSFFQKGTVEFRLFNSTLHAGKIKAYIQFVLALSAWSIESSDKIVFRSMNGYTAEKKVTLMYNILTNRLGLYGDEFKTCRLHMMKQLRKNAEASHKTLRIFCQSDSESLSQLSVFLDIHICCVKISENLFKVVLSFRYGIARSIAGIDYDNGNFICYHEVSCHYRNIANPGSLKKAIRDITSVFF